MARTFNLISHIFELSKLSFARSVHDTLITIHIFPTGVIYEMFQLPGISSQNDIKLCFTCFIVWFYLIGISSQKINYLLNEG